MRVLTRPLFLRSRPISSRLCQIPTVLIAHEENLARPHNSHEVDIKVVPMCRTSTGWDFLQSPCTDQANRSSLTVTWKMQVLELSLRHFTCLMWAQKVKAKCWTIPIKNTSPSDACRASEWETPCSWNHSLCNELMMSQSRRITENWVFRTKEHQRLLLLRSGNPHLRWGPAKYTPRISILRKISIEEWLATIPDVQFVIAARVGYSILDTKYARDC